MAEILALFVDKDSVYRAAVPTNWFGMPDKTVLTYLDTAMNLDLFCEVLRISDDNPAWRLGIADEDRRLAVTWTPYAPNFTFDAATYNPSYQVIDLPIYKLDKDGYRYLSLRSSHFFTPCLVVINGMDETLITLPLQDTPDDPVEVDINPGQGAKFQYGVLPQDSPFRDPLRNTLSSVRRIVEKQQQAD